MLVQRRVGLESVEAATSLLQRIRGLDPIFGEFEAADVQWWWRTPRPTDDVPDLFWFDSHGRPRAAVVATEWEDSVGLDVMALPGESMDWTNQLIDTALHHARSEGLGTIDFVVDRANDAILDMLGTKGFDRVEAETVQAWMLATDRPAVSPLGSGYQLADRAVSASPEHHLIRRSGREVDHRLRQTSLYRPDLDLVVWQEAGEVVAYGLFWFDPVTRTGLVEPMRTEDDHQGHGLARHVLTTGIDRLVRAGAQRIKVSHRPNDPIAAHLYMSAGFAPVKETVVVSRDSSSSPVASG